MDTVFNSLNPLQGWALNEESSSVANLLRDGVEAIHNLREPLIHQDAVFTMASIGAERLLKLSVGAHFLDSNGHWPSIKEMKAFGHNLVELQQKALEIVGKRGARTAYVQELIDFLASSPTLDALLTALSHYGQGGRFYHLDTLGSGEPNQQFMSPSDHWNHIEQTALEEFPEVRAAVEHDLESGIPVLSAQIALLFDKWWFATHRLLLNDGFGPHGKQIGWLVIPVGKSDPFRVAM